MEREKGLAIGAPEVFLKVYAGKSELCRVPGFVFREECGTMKEMRKDACQAGQNAEKQKQGGNNQTMEPKILFEDKDILVCEKPAGVPGADGWRWTAGYGEYSEKLSGGKRRMQRSALYRAGTPFGPARCRA